MTRSSRPRVMLAGELTARRILPSRAGARCEGAGEIFDFVLDVARIADTIVSVETIVSGSDIIDGMGKPVKTVPIHARLPEPDVAKVDEAAADELTSRSNMIARIVRDWAKRWRSKKPRK